MTVIAGIASIAGSIFRRRARRGALVGLACASLLAGGARASGFTTLYRFEGTPDGAVPNAPLVVGTRGVLYGTTSLGGTGSSSACGSGTRGCGTVFALTPPAGPWASWSIALIYSFSGPDGAFPNSGLVADVSGSLYGTTLQGGRLGLGTVFRLTPPIQADGLWTETVLHEFAKDVSNPGHLLVDRQGVLYGTAFTYGQKNCLAASHYCGIAYRLTPPSNEGASWRYTTLYRFNGGADGATPSSLVLAPSGQLYGTTEDGGVTPDCPASLGGCGIVFVLTPPALGTTRWTENVLHRFKGGSGGAYPDALLWGAGTLYGTSLSGGAQDCYLGGYFLGCGTIFALSPPPVPGGAWTETILRAFHGVSAGDGAGPQTLLEANGSFYGTTFEGGVAYAGCFGVIAGCGTVFQLMPGAGGTWKETVLHRFQGSDGFSPGAGLSFAPGRLLVGATTAGGNFCGDFDCGTVFAVEP